MQLPRERLQHEPGTWSLEVGGRSPCPHPDWDSNIRRQTSKSRVTIVRTGSSTWEIPTVFPSDVSIARVCPRLHVTGGVTRAKKPVTPASEAISPRAVCSILAQACARSVNRNDRIASQHDRRFPL